MAYQSTGANSQQRKHGIPLLALAVAVAGATFTGAPVKAQEGADTIEGGDGIDIIYIPKPKAEVELKSCSKTRCVASYKGEPGFEASITKGDVLIFLDGINRLK